MPFKCVQSCSVQYIIVITNLASSKCIYKHQKYVRIELQGFPRLQINIDCTDNEWHAHFKVMQMHQTSEHKAINSTTICEGVITIYDHSREWIH